MATDTVFIYTMQRGIQGGSWSRYVFPWTIEHYAHLDNTLYLRHGDDVSFVIEGGTDDDGTGYEGEIQWPWLDFGAPGVTKMLQGFDIVGIGTASVQFGYDQSAKGTITPKYAVPEDSYPGQVIPYPISAPSFSVKLTYDVDQAWEWSSLNLYVQDTRETA